MKFLKRSLFLIVSLFLILFVLAVVVLAVEKHQTDYLRVKNQDALQSNSYVVTNVNIVPMTSDTLLLNRTIEVENGVITKISEDRPVTTENVIDAGGSYLSPGLIDMHVHVWDRFELGLYLANGVTTVRSLLGMPFHIKVKKAIEQGELIGPMFYTSSPQLSGPKDGDPLHKIVHTPEEAKGMVVKYKERCYDFIKTYNLLPEPMFDAVLEQSRESGIPIVAHPSFEVDYSYHFNPDISTVEHTEDIYQQPLHYKIDREKLLSVIEGYALSHQTHCPTLTVFYNLTEIYNKGKAVLESEQAAYINPFIASASNDYERHMAIRAEDSTATQRINNQHRFHIEIVSKLHKAGVNLVCGTDAGIVNTAAGFSIHQELKFYTLAGMTNYEALKTATVNPSKIYHEFEQFGTIQEGKLANLVLTVENPLVNLETLTQPKWVMIKGRMVDQSMMNQLKEKAYKRNNFLATAIRVFSYILWGK